MRKGQLFIVMAILNLLAGVGVPIVVSALIGLGRTGAMSKYRELEVKGVVVRDAQKAKDFEPAKLSDDWADVPLYLTDGFNRVVTVSYGISVIAVINAVVFSLLWWRKADDERGGPVEKVGAERKDSIGEWG